MKKIAVLCTMALGAALLVLATAPAASAYPEQTCFLEVDHQVVQPGGEFTAKGTVTGTDSHNHAIEPASVHWTFTWNGETKLVDGSPAFATFTAPQVHSAQTFTLTAKSTSPVGDCVRHLDVQVATAIVAGPHQSAAGPHQGDDGLPNTGGPTFWLLVAALLMLVGGGGAVVVARRRS